MRKIYKNYKENVQLMSDLIQRKKKNGGKKELVSNYYQKATKANMRIWSESVK